MSKIMRTIYAVKPYVSIVRFPAMTNLLNRCYGSVAVWPKSKFIDQYILKSQKEKEVSNIVRSEKVTTDKRFDELYYNVDNSFKYGRSYTRTWAEFTEPPKKKYKADFSLSDIDNRPIHPRSEVARPTTAGPCNIPRWRKIFQWYFRE